MGDFLMWAARGRPLFLDNNRKFAPFPTSSPEVALLLYEASVKCHIQMIKIAVARQKLENLNRCKNHGAVNYTENRY